MRVFLEKMVLDLPDVVDPQPIGELDLVERLVVKAQLAILAPGLRQLVLVEQAEFHRGSPWFRPSPSRYADPSLSPLAGRGVFPCTSRVDW